MRIQQLKNGDLIADDIPESLKNKYIQDLNDKTRWRLQWRPCKYHTEEERECPKSGRITLLPWCKFLDEMISPVMCDGCSYQKDPEN